MTSSQPPNEAYVWIWLLGRIDPVVAGKVEIEHGIMSFNYGRSYLENADAIPIYEPELPLSNNYYIQKPPPRPPCHLLPLPIKPNQTVRFFRFGA